MNFSKNELLRKNRASPFLAYGNAGKRVFNFQANFSESEILEVLSSRGGGGGGGTWVKFCWVCAASLSEPLPHYSLFCGQL